MKAVTRLPSPARGRGAGGEGIQTGDRGLGIGDWGTPKAQAVARRGFTLVEMLAVVVIIGLLAGMITAAAISARNRAITARMVLEVRDLEMAVQSYRERFGEYPPDFTDLAAVQRHLSRAFPHCPPQNYPDFSNTSVYNPSTALVFWLGGIPDGDGVPSGFSANPRNPFQTPAQTPTRIGPFYDFDLGRLYTYEGRREYYAQGLPLGSARTGYGPYVYFRARAGNRYEPSQQHWGSGEDRIRPAIHETGSWVNRSTFQIHGPGRDGRYGNTIDSGPPVFPSGANYDPRMFDNVANFAQGTLQDEMP